MTSHAEALETSLAALTLDDRHAAAVQTARSIAAALDTKAAPSAVLLREYRPLLARLIEWGTPDEEDNEDNYAEFWRTLTPPTPAISHLAVVGDQLDPEGEVRGGNTSA